MGKNHLIRVLALMVMAGVIPSDLVSSEIISFNRDIRPILSENCFYCHGQDAKKRKADLRLDTFSGATADLGGHQAIVPNKVELSEMIVRIESLDSDEQMPPPDSNRHVSPEQLQLLKRWIAEGADYQVHWAFVALEKPDLYDHKLSEAIDHYIVSADLNKNHVV